MSFWLTFFWPTLCIVFCSACTMSSVRKFTFAISSPDELLVSQCTHLTDEQMTHGQPDGQKGLRNTVLALYAMAR